MTTETAPTRTSPADGRASNRLQQAMVAAGLAAFALMYGTQALLPPIGRTFGVGATAASLTVSVTTGLIALTVLPMSAFAERHGRLRLMAAGLGLAFASMLAGAAAPTFALLLAARAVDGIALAAVVAVAMGHLGAELDGPAASRAIGVYVSATTVGGLVGRLVPAAFVGLGGWRLSLAVLGVVGGLCAIAFVRLAPPARATTADHPRRAALVHLRDPGIVRLCLVAMLLMGGFVATYNYLTYRLAARPFDLSTGVVGLVFIAYLAGTVTSTLAGRAAVVRGRRPVLLTGVVIALAGLALTVADNLVCVLAGLVIFTGGFFCAHSVASAWVANRAHSAKSEASALYLAGYYLGSSLGGSLIGIAWTHGGWAATSISVACCYVVAGVIAVGVRERVPDQPRTAVSTA
jgi:YNFM family putative membrane transporter